MADRGNLIDAVDARTVPGCHEVVTSPTNTPGPRQTRTDGVPLVVALQGLLRTRWDGADPPTDQKVGSSNLFGRAHFQWKGPLRSRDTPIS